MTSKRSFLSAMGIFFGQDAAANLIEPEFGGPLPEK